MRTFEELWTVENLEKIKLEYLPSRYTHLCNASALFREIWDNYKSEVRALARREFSDAMPPSEAGKESDVLFYYELSCNTRFRFLQSEIERLSKEKQNDKKTTTTTY